MYKKSFKYNTESINFIQFLWYLSILKSLFKSHSRKENMHLEFTMKRQEMDCLAINN